MGHDDGSGPLGRGMAGEKLLAFVYTYIWELSLHEFLFLFFIFKAMK